MKPRLDLGPSLRASMLVRGPAAAAIRAVAAWSRFPGYLAAWRRYERLPGAERLRLRDAFPCLSDNTPSSLFDPHYLQQAIWAAERIFANEPSSHTDVGSQLLFAGILSAKLPVVFVDLRPLDLEIAQLRPLAGDVLNLPFPDRSVTSLSTLHVIEHIGLGRYGDPLNPNGTRLALAELQRVLAPAGNLFLSLPVGQPRVCFNAHRIHRPQDIVDLLAELTLVEFSAVDDNGRLQIGASLDEAAKLTYGCGLFWFRRPRDENSELGSLVDHEGRGE